MKTKHDFMWNCDCDQCLPLRFKKTRNKEDFAVNYDSRKNPITKNTKQVTIAIALLCVGGIIAGIVIAKYVDHAITKHEQVECQRWQQQAIDYAQVGYYITDWQKAQCEAVGYSIKVAPVVPRNNFY